MPLPALERPNRYAKRAGIGLFSVALVLLVTGLLLLWKGIGAYVCREPRYATPAVADLDGDAVAIQRRDLEQHVAPLDWDAQRLAEVAGNDLDPGPHAVAVGTNTLHFHLNPVVTVFGFIPKNRWLSAGIEDHGIHTTVVVQIGDRR